MRRSSCWSLCRDRVCRLERLNPKEFYLITYFIGSLSSVPYDLTVTMEGFGPYSQSHVWGMFQAGVDFNICPLSQASCSASPTFSSERRSQVPALGNVAPNPTPPAPSIQAVSFLGLLYSACCGQIEEERESSGKIKQVGGALHQIYFSTHLAAVIQYRCVFT